MEPVLAVAVAIAAQLQVLPPNLIPLDSDEGRQLLATSGANQDFFRLVGTLETQREPAFCGVASSPDRPETWTRDHETPNRGETCDLRV